jgi:hypothetical protein
VSGRIRLLYDFELEPEVRDWLDSLSDSDFKRVDEVCGLLAEKGTELGGPWSDHLEGAVRVAGLLSVQPGVRAHLPDQQPAPTVRHARAAPGCGVLQMNG